MLYQDMLKLTAINSNNSKLANLANSLTLEDWKQKRIGNKKLSKHLLQIGLDNETVSNLLSVDINDITTRVVWDEDTCLNQGNSIYYSSCQATDKRAKHGANPISQTQIEGDMKHLGKSLFFWVVGNSMSVDGKGFVARAKLRVMYADKDCTKVFGLWLEHIYGNALMLLANFKDLQDWWGTETPIYTSGERKSTPIYIPSASDGYQDTATTMCYTYDVISNDSLLKRAYKTRHKFGNVYKYGLDKVKFNPQNCEFVLPKIETKRWRGCIDSNARSTIDFVINVFGFPKSTNLNIGRFTSRFTADYGDKEVYVGFSEDSIDLYIDDIYVLNISNNRIEVTRSYGGFYRATSIPYCYDHKHKFLIVTTNLLNKGFAIPWSIPFYKSYYETSELMSLFDEFMKNYESANTPN